MAELCTKRNSLGDCIEVVDVGDVTILKFKEEEKLCNKPLYDKWKQMVTDGKIKALD